MINGDEKPLSDRQLATLQLSFHRGSMHASQSLASWIGKPSLVEIDALQQMPLEEATDVLCCGDEPVCFCSMQINGQIGGEMILTFDDASGLALADMLLDQPPGTSTEWTELSTSAALETANIVCCAYLNSLSESIAIGDESFSLLPAPPRFSREFAESLLEFAFMGQAVAFDRVIAAQTRFRIDGVPVSWTLLFVPDAAAMSRLPELLRSVGSANGEEIEP